MKCPKCGFDTRDGVISYGKNEYCLLCTVRLENKNVR